MASTIPLTFESVSEQLSYCPESGLLTWKVSKKGNRGAGTVAGGVNAASGYVLVGLQYQRHYAHRLAWLLHHGCWPVGQIDHINGDSSDNRIANLRDVSHALNQMNRHRTKPNKHGLRGIDLDPKTGKYRARVTVRRVKHNLGYFDTPEEAHHAYKEGMRALNPQAA